MTAQHEPLLKIQTAGYINFIREFTEQVSIMKKTFYVVVPYEEAALSSKKGIFGGLFGSKKPKEMRGKSAADVSFEERQTQLDERVSVVSSGLESCGARTERLKTEEVIELFYRSFNPGDIQPAFKIEQPAPAK
jgi:hypothetical protein